MCGASLSKFADGKWSTFGKQIECVTDFGGGSVSCLFAKNGDGTSPRFCTNALCVIALSVDGRILEVKK